MELSFEVLDCSLCSHSLLFKFIDYLQEECKLGHCGRLGYIDAISDMIDFRKIDGALTQFFETCYRQNCASTELVRQSLR